MKLSVLMEGKTPDPTFKGLVVNDNNVLAINITPGTEGVHPDDYEVVQLGIVGVDPQMNPQTQDDTYLRAGTSTSKTGHQRSFAVSGTRYVGDEAQNYMFSFPVAYGIGSAVVTDYVFFNILTGLGETGKASIIVNSDGGGNAGENASISVDIKQSGEAPVAYTYAKKTP